MIMNKLGFMRGNKETAKGREAEVAKGLSVGADAYVTKPFSTAELVETVTRLLKEGS